MHCSFGTFKIIIQPASFDALFLIVNYLKMQLKTQECVRVTIMKATYLSNPMDENLNKAQGEAKTASPLATECYALEHVSTIQIFNPRIFHMLFLLSKTGLCM
jgi:hypothetical protein